jgi:integrase
VRRTAPHTFADKLAAEAFVVDLRRKIDRGQFFTGAPAKITFAAYADTWLANRQVSGRPLKDRTRAHYRAILNDHLVPAFGDKLLSTVTPADVRDWYAAALTDRPTMRAHSYGLLKTIMATAVAEERIDANPCRIRGASAAKRLHKIRPASPQELTALTAQMPENLQLAVMLSSWAALRFGELVELRRGDIDLDAEVIRVRRAAVRSTGGTFSVTSPKSTAGVRDVAIPPHLLPMITDHLERFVGTGADAMIFPTRKGGHLQPSTLARHWYRARAGIGRPDLRWHDLRHSGAVLAAATGASLPELMDRLGHSTATAALRYQHTVDGRGREIAALLSKLADA